MTLDFGTHASASGGVHKSLQRAADVGATSAQIFSKNERQWIAKALDPGVVESFHRERERTGIRQMVIHDSYLINLASPKEDLLEKSMAAFTDELERGQILDIQYLVTHPGAHTGSGVEQGIQQFADSLNRIFDALPDNNVITCLETTAGQGTALGRSFEEIAAIIDLVEAKERVGVCFDTCHAFAAGYDLRTEEATVTVFDEFDRVIGLDKLRVLHLNDSKQSFASNKDRHEHIGKGEIGPGAFRAIVNDPRLAGLPAILETEKDDAGEYDRMNLEFLRGLVTG
ncbi:MAG: deoxyribonuclease IV [Thermomicrobiales bacterium]|nr:deoxyribonuclease IV [Thermomicrobiales bacterium]MCO5223716.1 deoxyribonuclease IV [Thermomicrobiales bacterium]MCO5228545.1 deoxyribonuclease IV [Thermomicrobiales bacterium]